MSFFKLSFHLQVSLSNVTFNHFLRKVIRYCRPNQLIELDLKLSRVYQLSYDFTLLEGMRPYLRNLRKFHLQNHSHKLESLFAFYQNDINTIKSLTIDGIAFFRECLNQFPNVMPNITEIRLINVDLYHHSREVNLIMNKLPNLERFICSSYYPQAVLDIGEKLTWKFPGLKAFGFLTHRFNCSNDDPFDNNERFNILQSLSFLRGFTNLAELELGADCDCRNVYQILQYVPNIRTFSIWQIEHMFQESVEIRRIVKSIREIIANRRNRFPANDHVHFIVSDRQYREFKAIKRIDHFIRLTIRNSPRLIIRT